MKRVLLLCTGAFLLTLPGISQGGDEIVNIPDTAFLYALIDYGVDTDEDSLISFAEAEAVSNLWVMNKGITDMTGIEAFVMLDSFACDGNNIDTLPLSTLSELTYLSCGTNPIESLDISMIPGLLELWVVDGELTFLDVSNNSALYRLNVSANNLTDLDLSNNVGLHVLDVMDNKLTDLDVSSNVNLEEIYCRGNNLEGLDLSSNLNLERLYCRENNLESLDLSMNSALVILDCSYNAVTSLILPDTSALWSLACHVNLLDSIDVTGCPGLNIFVPWGNNITSLDLSNNPELIWLSCEINHLTELDVSKNPELVLLWCGDNMLSTLDLTNNNKLGSFPTAYGHLNVDNMPSLTEVCVWDGFPGDAEISFEGSPNVCFDSIACDGVCTAPGTGIEGFDHSEFKIYPNPVTYILTIETAGFGPHSIQLHSLNGQEIYATTFTGSLLDLDLSPCRKGIYFLRIRSENHTVTRKVVKL